MPAPVVPLRATPPPVQPRGTRTLRCRTVAVGQLHQLNYIRDLPPQPVVERAIDGLLADSSAPNASEALLAALGSCLAQNIHASALVQNIPIVALELDVSAEINTNTAAGSGVTPQAIGFETIRVAVRLDADAPRVALEAIVRHATLRSPVANTLHNPVHLDVMLAPARSSLA